MAHYTEVARPAMRRKSSAQNLLSSFKSATSSSQSVNTLPTVPPPVQTSGTISSVTGMAYTAALASATTPTATTPLGRADSTDGQYADNIIASLVGATSPPLGSSTSVESLRDLVQRRLVTLTYIRNIYEGRSHWFHTLLITRSELERELSNGDMKRRTSRFAALGFSLSTLLDITSPLDLLRGLLNAMEFDQSKEDSEKPKIRLLNKKTTKRGAGSGTSEYTESASYSVVPQVPFALDYHETVLSLLDVVSEVYNKISKILGPSSIPHSFTTLGPLASLTAYPGVSYLFASEANNQSSQYPSATFNNISSHGSLQHLHYHNSSSNPNLHQPVQFPSGSTATLTGSSNSGDNDSCSSLWSIANASSVGMGMGASLPQPTISWSAAQSEMILKIDAKLKKVTATLLKEIDTIARKGIQDELASLGPLLGGSLVSGDGTLSNGSGKSLYDFDG